MMHVKQIKSIIDEGRAEEAFDALDQLLSLGPQNTEALKLRAALYGQQGRFAEEFKVWGQIIDIDNEDPDAIRFFQEKHIEERENYYFADDLPDGGRRYMAYPRALMSTTMVALAGCLVFLVFSKVAQINKELETPAILFSVFGALVLVPWGFTLNAWVRSIKSITMNRHGMEFATRFKVKRILWADFKEAWLANTVSDKGDKLHLVLIPKEDGREKEYIEVDLSVDSTSIKAKSFFLKDVYNFYGNYEYISKEKLEYHDKKVKTY